VGDVERALAFVAHRRARAALPAREWVHELSLGLGWMPPGAARAFVERAQHAGLLAEAEGGLRLTLATEPEWPRGFRPDPEAVPEGQAVPASSADPFLDWVGRVAARAGLPREAVLAQVAERQARMGGLMSAWAAVLWLAAEAGLDVRAAAAPSGADVKA
jgi:hypothetical protein